MKTRTLVSILILVLAVLIIIGGCATPKMLNKTVRSVDVDEVKRLIEAGADVNAQGKNEFTALMDASFVGHPEIVQLLIEGGADVNAQNKDGETALMVASYNGHTELEQLLREAGAK